jgi:hypothetical protein
VAVHIPLIRITSGHFSAKNRKNRKKTLSIVRENFTLKRLKFTSEYFTPFFCDRRTGGFAVRKIILLEQQLRYLRQMPRLPAVAYS